MIQKLAMLTFVSPWWAAGAVLAVALPLVAHLLSRAKYREVLYPATRLVRQAVEQTTRIERPRHRLLMLLRWLLLLLVVLAFMRPRWLPQAEANSDRRGVCLIVLIDASASMHRVEDGATLYERALRRADDLLNDLDPSRDAASVVRVGREPAPVLPGPTTDLTRLRGALNSTRPTYESADWAAGVAAAQRIAGQGDRRARILVISDQQGDGPGFPLESSALSGVSIGHIRIDGPADNTAVRLIDVSPYPPIANRPVTATVGIDHFGDQPRMLRLSATLGGAEAQRMAAFGPGISRLVEFELPAGPPGAKRLRIGFDANDALAFDDMTGRVLDVQDSSEVLVIHGAGDSSAVLASRIAATLNPTGDAGTGLPRVRLAEPDTAASLLEAADPSRLRTAVLLSAKLADEALGRAVQAYLNRGGGVVVFIADVRHAARQTAMPLPLLITANAGYSEIDTPAASIDFQGEPLRIFEGPGRAGLASLVWPGVDPARADPGSERLLRGEDDTPIVVAQSHGRSRLIAINTSLSPGPGGLLAEPAFVVLFNELCRYASPGPVLPPAAHPGDPIPEAPDQAQQIVRPDDTDSGTSKLTAPGVYAALDDSGRLIGGVFVELDPAESDPRTGDNWVDRDGTAVGSPKGAAPTSASLATQRVPPIELWPYLVVGALLLAGGESLLLGRFASPKGGAA